MNYGYDDIIRVLDPSAINGRLSEKRLAQLGSVVDWETWLIWDCGVPDEINTRILSLLADQEKYQCAFGKELWDREQRTDRI